MYSVQFYRTGLIVQNSFSLNEFVEKKLHLAYPVRQHHCMHQGLFTLVCRNYCLSNALHCNRLSFRSCHFFRDVRCPLSDVRCPMSGRWVWSPLTTNKSLTYLLTFCGKKILPRAKVGVELHTSWL